MNIFEKIKQRSKSFPAEYMSKQQPLFQMENESDFAAAQAKEAEKLEALAKQSGYELGERTILNNWYDRPVEEKTVLLLGLGLNVRGNMFYILQELNHSPKFDGFRIYVHTKASTDPAVKKFIQENGWDRTEAVSGSGKYSLLMETAQFLITETYFPTKWIKREGQIYINIWHGTPLKKMGLEKTSLNKYVDGNTQKNFMLADYLMYPNAYTRKHMLRSYRVSELMYGKTLLNGYPRTSGILDTSHTEELKQCLAPEGQSIITFMPTWKDYIAEDAYKQEIKDLLDYLDENLRDDQILYVNLHHKVSDALDYSRFSRIRQFPQDIDSYQILSAADTLISDYSSVFFDFLASRKNIVLYCHDYELYRKKRGTYMDMMQLPFHLAKTKEEILDGINRGKDYDDEAAYEEYCPADDSRNAERLLKLITGETEELGLKSIPKNGKKKVLLFADTPYSSKRKGLYSDFAQNHSEDYDVFLAGIHGQVKDALNKDQLRPIKNCNFIGVKEPVRWSSYGELAYSMYQDGALSSEDFMEYIKFDSALNFRNYFGNASFDLVIVYRTLNIHLLLLLINSGAPALVFLNEEMLNAMEEGNSDMCDILRWYASRGGVFAAESDADAERIRKLMGDSVEEVFLANSESSLDRFVSNYLRG